MASEKLFYLTAEKENGMVTYRADSLERKLLFKRSFQLAYSPFCIIHNLPWTSQSIS
jgi:hypothetical protein